MSLINSGIGFV